MKDVQQKQCSAGVQMVFTMQLKRSQFLVKNFTDNQITVKLGDNESYSIIGAGSWERVFNNIEDKTSGTSEATNIVKVTAVEDGLVEVASVDF
nr:MAG TPA: hypothetical protein [Caudoviricetes sp.]